MFREQSAIIPADKYQDIIDEFVKNGAYLVNNPKEKKPSKAIFVDSVMNRDAVGRVQK